MSQIQNDTRNTPPPGNQVNGNSDSDEIQNTFIQLMVAQIRNQDPTKPVTVSTSPVAGSRTLLLPPNGRIQSPLKMRSHHNSSRRKSECSLTDIWASRRLCLSSPADTLLDRWSRLRCQSTRARAVPCS